MMSSNEDRTITKENKTDDEIVTDAVHERMRENNYIFCEQCKERMATNITGIEAHFTSKNHQSDSNCIYCHGEVYPIVICHIDDDGTEMKKDDVFHKCHRKENP